jgi:Mannosyl-glycoprotein endo-beta-N-acetylglucosaminidase/N-acetylmuramoyl-L-alanine amidase
MGRIFIAATYGGIEMGGQEPNSALSAVTEAPEMLLLRDLAVAELRGRNFEVISVPDFERVQQTIDWIDRRAHTNDVALGIHADAYAQARVHGASIFYISKNGERKNHAQMMLMAFCGRLNDMPNLGVKSDSASALGSLAFCRRLGIPSLLMEIGLNLPAQDRPAQQQHRREVALGIADALAAWNRDMAGGSSKAPDYLPIDLQVNGEPYPENGILINGNVYIPIDLADRLSANVAGNPLVRRIRYRGVIYVKSIELRDFHISVAPGMGRTFQIRTQLPVTLDEMERIVGQGQTNAEQLRAFLEVNNSQLPAELALADLPQLYIQECSIEGINWDMAFVQMCMETRFLHFSAALPASKNNFASLGGNDADWAHFANPQLGVRAHVQQLKAYASTADLKQAIISPRFFTVRRGVAPTVRQLATRWSTDGSYAPKLLATMRRMYEFVNLF